MGTLLSTLSSQNLIGPFNFSILRLLLAVGFVRVALKGERISGGLNSLDKIIIFSSLWAIISSSIHAEFTEALKFRLGFVYNTCGAYFLFRIFFQSLDDFYRTISMAIILLVPVAIEMIYEQKEGNNLFFYFSGLDVNAAIREGQIRSQGPFDHAILAGSIGAVLLPLVIGCWNNEPKITVLGVVACFTMILCSGSSGPILSAFAGVAAIFMFRFRSSLKIVKYIAIIGYFMADLLMRAPAYYILAKIDIIGGSTGWHRARLIESSIEHLNEWWLGGTDYTWHWMPTGVYFSQQHTDITNHFLWLGVMAGLPIVLMTVLAFLIAFKYVGQVIEKYESDSGLQKNIFKVWLMGSCLFAHAVTCIGVAYFDQSFIFLYLALSAIGSIYNSSFSGAEKKSSDFEVPLVR
jgi:hypothetical protein